MERRNVLLMILFLSISEISAKELWHGFTTEMDYNQVVSKIKAEYKITYIQKYDEYFGPFAFYPDGYRIWDYHVDRKLIRYSYDIDHVGVYRITADFLYGKLMAIEVNYHASEYTGKEKMINHFGKPHGYYTSPIFNTTHNYYWLVNGVIILQSYSSCSYTDEVSRKKLIVLYEDYIKRCEREATEREVKENSSIVF